MSVLYHQVKTRLEQVCHTPGGKGVAAALADAESNLQALEPETLILIDEGMAEISERLKAWKGDRPDDETLVRVHARADELLGYCAVVQLPGLDLALVRLCQLADAVLRCGSWRDDTFGPSLLVLRLARSGSLDAGALDVLLAGIDQCTALYESHSSAALSPN